jgi:hypothetical protein
MNITMPNHNTANRTAGSKHGSLSKGSSGSASAMNVSQNLSLLATPSKNGAKSRILAAVDELFSSVDDEMLAQKGRAGAGNKKEKNSADITKQKYIVLECEQPAGVASICRLKLHQGSILRCCTLTNVSVVDRHLSSEFMKIVITCVLHVEFTEMASQKTILEYMINMAPTSRLVVGYDALLLLSHYSYGAACDLTDSDLESLVSRSTELLTGEAGRTVLGPGSRHGGSSGHIKGTEDVDEQRATCKLTFRLPSRVYEQLFASQVRFRFGDCTFTDAAFLFTRNETNLERVLKAQALKTISRMQTMSLVKIADAVVRVLINDYLKNQHTVLCRTSMSGNSTVTASSPISTSTILSELQKLELSVDLEELIATIHERLCQRFGDWISEWSVSRPDQSVLKAAEMCAYELSSLRQLCRNLIPASLAHAMKDIRKTHESPGKSRQMNIEDMDFLYSTTASATLPASVRYSLSLVIVACFYLMVTDIRCVVPPLFSVNTVV